ncbi:MAG: hypothetical protein IAE99_13190 [Rhodothermales bacterium]|nr:hypothetical protein [Rhodothermales bacterium]
MAYSGEDLFRNYRKTYIISPFQASQVTPLGYDLRVGFVLALKYNGEDAKASFGAEMQKITHQDADVADGYQVNEISINPGGSILIVTVEQICLSHRVLATVQAKASISMQGLFLNPVTVDPNFASESGTSGRLVIYMHNNSGRRVKIREKQKIATLIMHEVATPTSHHPEKSGFEDVLKVLGDNYDQSVLEKINVYIGVHANTRGFREFERDRRALMSYIRT